MSKEHTCDYCNVPYLRELYSQCPRCGGHRPAIETINTPKPLKIKDWWKADYGYIAKDPWGFGHWIWANFRVFLVEAEIEVMSENATNGYYAYNLAEANQIVNDNAGLE